MNFDRILRNVQRPLDSSKATQLVASKKEAFRLNEAELNELKSEFCVFLASDSVPEKSQAALDEFCQFPSASR